MCGGTHINKTETIEPSLLQTYDTTTQRRERGEVTKVTLENGTEVK